MNGGYWISRYGGHEFAWLGVEKLYFSVGNSVHITTEETMHVEKHYIHLDRKVNPLA
jgi:hypothetical protein